MWKAQVRVPPVSLVGEVRRQGEQQNRTISFGRHLSAAVAGDWVLVLEDRGQCWAVTLVGTGPTAYPSNPDIGGGGAGNTLTVPPNWAGHTVHDNNSGKDWYADYWWFGHWVNATLGYDQVLRAVGLYTGLAGIEITDAKLTITAATSKATTTAQLALFLLPEDEPATTGFIDPASIVQLAAIDAPDLPTAAAGVTITLPTTWTDQLTAGTANGLGLVDASTFSSPPSIPVPPSLEITYA